MMVDWCSSRALLFEANLVNAIARITIVSIKTISAIDMNSTFFVLAGAKLQVVTNFSASLFLMLVWRRTLRGFRIKNNFNDTYTP